MADTAARKLHIVMFPWLAFGHMIPFLELAKLIAQKGHKISFISTPKNIERLPKLPPDLVTPDLISFIKVPLPLVKNLPENAEATVDLPTDQGPYLKVAYDSLQETVARFLEESAPDWVFYDFAPYWLGPVAAKLNIPSVYYCVMAAYVLAFIGPTEDADRKGPEDWTVSPKWVPFPSPVAFRYYEVMKMIEAFREHETRVSDIDRFKSSAQGCDVLAVKSCYDFEPEWLKLLEDLHRKPVIPVGHLPPTPYDDGGKDEAWTEMKEWLDKRKKGSVLFVGFGSEAKLSQDELTEIALGVELSGLPFLWVLRKQRVFADSEVIEFPDGFEERTKGRGVVWTSWGPQVKILSHDAVGGYLMHSGLGSVVEAVQFGKALILLTFYADQGLNARVLEEKKMGYAVPRNEQDGRFTREAVAESVKLVMVEEEGKVYRDKVKEMRGMFGDRGKQDRYVDNLLTRLQQIQKERKPIS
ncbi:hypothetical protein RJ639_045821 [Escallonia herrerae]|uniref:UDP-glycosyltransferase n=1 Tax=Escallonia herrerae TaxID=1293975 RepID=A0AA89B007_9ASTE|nr:hypothetical protein RJ639_022577 [Escallonia herrerae]KAK3021313.1 hypothetical protein RJ639_045821 [Escallonia herrerae]